MVRTRRESTQRLFDELGETEFRRRLTSGEGGPDHTREYKAGKALLEEMDRAREVGHRTAAADRGAEMVGHAAESNRIGWAAISISILALLVSLMALWRS